MKVLHISFSDNQGGAAIAAQRIHQSVLKKGLDSKMLVVSKTVRDSTILRITPSTHHTRRLARAFRRFCIDSSLSLHTYGDPHQLFSDDRSWLGAELAAGLPDCDVLHLHWVAGMVDYRAFLPKVAGKTPLVWTLHDMNPFTGGCHYDSLCGHFTEQCGNCPLVKKPNPGDYSHRVWKHKQAAFSQIPTNRLHIVTPSRWLTGEASRSSLFRHFPISTIPYGLDLEEFAPRDKHFSRKFLGIPEDARVVLFVAQSVSDKRKGCGLLLDALKQLDNVFLLSLGDGEPLVSKNGMHLEFIKNKRFPSLVYSAADVFAIPSLEDNLPQTVLESMACGVPVVGFQTGGVPDVVEHGVTGLLVSKGDSLSLSAAIKTLLSDEEVRSRMSLQSRKVAEEKFAYSRQAQAYSNIYADLLGDGTGKNQSKLLV